MYMIFPQCCNYKWEIELSERQEFQSWGLVSVRNTIDAASVLMLNMLFNNFFHLK